MYLIPEEWLGIIKDMSHMKMSQKVNPVHVTCCEQSQSSTYEQTDTD